MNVRSLETRELAAAGAVLAETFGRAAAERGFPPPWRTVDEAAALARAYLEAERTGAIVAEDGGAVVGVGFVRRRGDVATVGPLAVSRPGQGLGAAILDELIGRAEGWGCTAIRAHQDAWNPVSFALYAGRAFCVADVVATIERPAGRPPQLEGSRGLEVAPFRSEDLAEVAAMDVRLTGLERRDDLAASVRLVARRRGTLVAFAGTGIAPGVTGGPILLGPALALDVADLGPLVARAIGDGKKPVRARLSTATAALVPMALALGFRVVELGTIMARGTQPAARPPQIYALVPEVL